MRTGKSIYFKEYFYGSFYEGFLEISNKKSLKIKMASAINRELFESFRTFNVRMRAYQKIFLSPSQIFLIYL